MALQDRACHFRDGKTSQGWGPLLLLSIDLACEIMPPTPIQLEKCACPHAFAQNPKLLSQSATRRGKLLNHSDQPQAGQTSTPEGPIKSDCRISSSSCDWVPEMMGLGLRRFRFETYNIAIAPWHGGARDNDSKAFRIPGHHGQPIGYYMIIASFHATNYLSLFCWLRIATLDRHHSWPRLSHLTVVVAPWKRQVKIAQKGKVKRGSFEGYLWWLRLNLWWLGATLENGVEEA